MVRGAPERVGVTGHQDMPSEAESLLRGRLQELFPNPPNVEVVCSLAIGADSLVATQLTNRGAGLHAIVPCANYEATFDARTLMEYRRLIDIADVIETLDFSEPSEEAFMAAGSLVVRSSDWLIAVWDGKEARGLGGTADVVRLARSLGKDVHVIWPDGLTR